MEKSPSVEIVPPASVEIVKPNIGGLTPQILKGMGIDISISKEDLLSVITQALSDQATKRIEDAQCILRSHNAVIEEKRLHFFEVILRRIGRKPKVKALAKALGTYHDQAYTIVYFQGHKVGLHPTFTDPDGEMEWDEDNSFEHPPLFVPEGFKWSTPEQCEEKIRRRHQRGDYAESNLTQVTLNEPVKKWEIPEELRLVKHELETELHEATEDQRTLVHDTKRAHTRVIKDLLLQTEHGAALLQMLDTRTLTARVKGVLDADRAMAEAKREKDAYRWKHGTTHYEIGDKDQAACGTAKRKKTQLDTDTSKVNCDNCRRTSAFRDADREQKYKVRTAVAKATTQAMTKKEKSKASKPSAE